MKYIYHHLGLGDHIICNGMVRYFCDLNQEVGLFCHSHYYELVKYMYRDLKNLKIFKFDTESEIRNYILKNNISSDLLLIGFGELQKYLEFTTFDKAFYKIAGLEFDIRFNKFYLKRDLIEEDKVYKTLNPNNEKYIFVHDDPNRGFNINVDTDLKIIRNDCKFNIFNYLKILENAEEIHYMQSSFADLINSYKLNAKLYLHKYVREYPPSIQSIGLNKILEIG
jgi:hypothetical protein